MSDDLVAASPADEPQGRSSLATLRRFTPARIALGRAGTAQTTEASLRFALDHARARDAVHDALDVDALRTALEARGWPVALVRSKAVDRPEYLRRPDLGRQLDDASRAALSPFPCDVAIIAADGLSATAVSRNLVPVLDALRAELQPTELVIGPIILAEQGRVALGDEIGQALGARLTITLIGERPGLSAADSLGAYITFAPKAGTMDSNRSCISNIRPAGLAYEEAARQLAALAKAALRLGMTGVRLGAALGQSMLEP